MAANTSTASTLPSENIHIKTKNEQTECPNSDLKEKYFQQLMEFYNSQMTSLRKPWTKSRILEVIQILKSDQAVIESGNRRNASQYYWSTKYEVATFEGEECLIMKRNNAQEPSIQVVPVEQYYDLLSELHIEFDHISRDRMTDILKNKYYIPKKAVEILIALCPTCDMKRQRKKHVSKINLKNNVNLKNSARVDLIDFQSLPEGDFKWVLKYQDCSTKFLQLRPVRTDQASEIAVELVKIFLTFGPPNILVSNSGDILEEIEKIWPDCNIYHGFPSSPSQCQSTRSLELDGKYVADMLHSWMQENGSSSWSLGCHFVQYRINTSISQPRDDESPYRAFFGRDPHSNTNPVNPLKQEEDGVQKRELIDTQDDPIPKKKPFNVGDIVHVAVPRIDRGPLKTKFIVAKITDFNNGVYQVGTKSGIIKGWFPRNELVKTTKVFNEVVPKDLVTLKEAVSKQTLFAYQEPDSCDCKPAKNQCRHQKCFCFNKKVFCGPKCHSNLVCANKI
ncbi:KRAB-A domain-containing protein 2-like [Plodia interpunctella]|uniref:KRAB-A domain-containing protein 2-like n=1 Tax=Plodia interpunctella TaxID=58824 RepID=UPI002367ED36|nr:KRAB-A domain-containing protein 2-like [Plodia interpunctella]